MRSRLLRGFLGAALAVLTTAGTLAGAAPAASAAPGDDPYGHCLNRLHPSFTDQEWQAGGNNLTAWSAPYGIVNADAFLVTAWGSSQINYLGTNKSVDGDPVIAPERQAWPMPGENEFMLMAKISSGRIWHYKRNRWYVANQWFPIGSNSGCFGYDAQNGGWPTLTFGINDPDIGDNGGGPMVTVRQWW